MVTPGVTVLDDISIIHLTEVLHLLEVMHHVEGSRASNGSIVESIQNVRKRSTSMSESLC